MYTPKRKLRRVNPKDYLGESKHLLSKSEWRKYRRQKRHNYSF
jgi:hypothetical protein